MTPGQLAQEIALFLDGEYLDGAEANINARAEGGQVVFSVGVFEQPTKYYRAALVEITKEEAL